MSPSSVSYALFAPDGEYKMHIFRSGVDSRKSPLAILGNGWDGTPTGQSLFPVALIVIREKALVGHSKIEHFIYVIQLPFTFLCLLK
jgi:hypothetical protein